MTDIGVTVEGIPIEEVDPKVFEQIHLDENAAYGYSPNEGTAYSQYDFTDIETAQNNRAIRQEYLQQSEKIQQEINKMIESDCNKDEIASKVVEMRNLDKVNARAKMKPEELAPIEVRNIELYGNKIGPDAQWLFKSKKEKLLKKRN